MVTMAAFLNFLVSKTFEETEYAQRVNALTEFLLENDADFENATLLERIIILETLYASASGTELKDHAKSAVDLLLINMQIQQRNMQLQHFEQIEATRILDSLRTQYYPVLCDRTNSEPHHTPENHKPADTEESDIIPALPLPPEFWKATLWARAPEKMISCDSEQRAQKQVETILESVIQGLGLDKVIEVVSNRMIGGIECDVLLVYRNNRMPFAGIEVKKPSNVPRCNRLVFFGKESGATRSKSAVAGQNWNQLHAIGMFGFKKVFGMITNGNYWRLTCSDEIDPNFLQEDKVASIVSGIKAKEKSGTDNDEGEGGEGVSPLSTSPQQQIPELASKQSSAKEFKLYMSPVVPAMRDTGKTNIQDVNDAGEKIVSLMATFVLNSCSELLDLLEVESVGKAVYQTGMPCRVLNDKIETFAFQSISPTKLKLSAFLNATIKNIYLVKRLGSGANGDCCLGISATGAHTCAVKFMNGPCSATGDLVKRELQNWINVYGAKDTKDDVRKANLPPCRVQTLLGNNSSSLVMPVLTPIYSRERETLLVNGHIAATLVHFAASGFLHRDIKWRHFGYFNGTLYMCDMGDVSPESQGESRDSWVEESLRTLVKAARIEIDDAVLRKAIKSAAGILSREKNNSRPKDPKKRKAADEPERKIEYPRRSTRNKVG
jgi:hypothetical protein